MRHAEVAEAPCHQRYDSQQRIGLCLAADVSHGQRQIAGQLLCIIHNIVKAACCVNTEYNDHYKCQSHNDTLDKVSCTCCKESADTCVQDDYDGTDYHCGVILNIKERVEQLAACCKAGRCIWNKENQDYQCSYTLKSVALVTVTVLEEIRNRDRLAVLSVGSQSLCNDEPVYICTYSQTDSRPACLRSTAEECNARKSHKQPAAHIGRFRTHCCNDRAEFSAAQIEIAYVVVLLGTPYTDKYHCNKIYCNGYQHGNVV